MVPHRKSFSAKPLTAAQPIEDGRRGEAVRHGADRGLELAEGVPGVAPEPAVGLAHGVTALRDFQARAGLVPDGFASADVLARLRGR